MVFRNSSLYLGDIYFIIFFGNMTSKHVQISIFLSNKTFNGISTHYMFFCLYCYRFFWSQNCQCPMLWTGKIQSLAIKEFKLKLYCFFQDCTVEFKQGLLFLGRCNLQQWSCNCNWLEQWTFSKAHYIIIKYTHRAKPTMLHLIKHPKIIQRELEVNYLSLSISKAHYIKAIAETAMQRDMRQVFSILSIG